ncbi:MAG: DUF4442 domain-containing protein [Deltaproteobacteria bacterium]|jgi:acyl-coenzyme A thioesterase PaaI-like protein|nr:DUF4442 domain-containing protein [Deltaproteobacteria bacterium]MBT4526698.1 DUF4442 domain-containing protein [Deltaproteobacteria bacterium]
MDITKIPFNKFIKISNSNNEENSLTLLFENNLKNHLGTFHAGAQFVLAEACSGHTLQLLFSDLSDKVVPVLRKSATKFKKTARSDIRAKAMVAETAKFKFEQQLQKKGRATISVEVDVYDIDNIVTMSGTFEWFIQYIDIDI